MKVVPFQIPKDGNEGIKIQQERLPHFYNHLHQHPEIQLTYIKESYGTIIAGDYVGPFAAGDIFMIGSNQPHVFRNDAVFFQSKKMKAEAITLFFDDQIFGEEFWLLPELKNALAILQKSHGGYRITSLKKQLLLQDILEITAASGIQRIILFLKIIQSLTQRNCLKPLSDKHSNKPINSFDGNRLNTIVEFSFKEFHRPIQLKEVAALANMTVQAFCLYFKKRTRKTYISFLNELRIQHACRLLLEDKTIREVCYESGFTNLSNFNRIFMKIKGLTPGQFRKQHAS